MEEYLRSEICSMIESEAKKSGLNNIRVTVRVSDKGFARYYMFRGDELLCESDGSHWGLLTYIALWKAWKRTEAAAEAEATGGE